MFEKSEQETFDYTVKCTKATETLRQQWPRLVFTLGCELTIFMQGIIEGNTLLERMGNPSFWENIKTGVHIKPLNAFLAKANEAVRQVFHGKVTYASAPLETVDWSLFDFVCVDHFREARINDSYVELLTPYFAHNKPVIIGEFGCCTYQGAEDAGGWGWAIVNPDANPPLLNGTYVRDEGLQARELTDQLGILDDAGVGGAFVFTFVFPIFTHNDDPHYDFDMASFSLVKSYDDAAWAEALKGLWEKAPQNQKDKLNDMIAALEIPTKPRGKQSTTYPDMPWEPKESFKAVADYYAMH